MDTYDGIVIGNFITEQKLNDGTINSQAIGKAYSLKLRPDKNAQDSGVLNIGTTDDSSVYEVVTLFEEQLDENTDNLETLLTNIDNSTNDIELVLEEAQDVSKNIGIIETEHKKVHEGEHFFYANYIELGNGATTNIVLETDSKVPHLTFEVSSTDYGFTYESYEDITCDADGSLLTALNNNRLSETLPTMVFRLNPSNIVTTSATPLRRIRSGTAKGGSNAKSGNESRATELILKHETKYLLKITNLASSTNYVNLKIDWYEV